MRRIILIILILTLPGYVFAQETAETVLPALKLEELIKEALEQNPQISALKNRIEALEHRIPQAKALPDPMIGVGLMNYPVTQNPFDIGRVPMTQTQVSYAQTFPAPGTRSLRAEVAEWDVKIAAGQLLDRKVVIASLVRKVYLQLAFAVKSLEISRRNLDVLRQFLSTAESKYRVGKGILQDVLKAQVAMNKLETDILKREQVVSTAKSKMNVLLNRDPNEPMGDPIPLKLSPVEQDFSSAMAEALKNNPSLQVLSDSVMKSGSAVKLAETRLNPDYTLRFAYSYRYDDIDFWTAGISFNLPFWRGSKQREAIAEKEAERRVNNAKLAAMRNDVGFAVREALDTIKRSGEQFDSYKQTVIPQAEMALDSALSGYQVDKVDFLTLLDNQKTLFDLELGLEVYVLEHELSVVDLDNAIGRIPVTSQGDN